MTSGPELPPVATFATSRTARVAHLGPVDAPRSLWICLHGYRQLAPWFLRHLRILDDGSRRLLAPEALNRFYLGDPDGRHGPETRVGATWMTREGRDDEIADYVRYLSGVAEGAAHPGRPLVVLGFSQGAHTAARWVLAGRATPRVVILWGEGLPHDVDEAALAASDVRWVLVRGEGDGSRDPAREARDEALLTRAEVRWEVRLHPGGHRLAPEVVAAVAEELGA